MFLYIRVANTRSQARQDPGLLATKRGIDQALHSLRKHCSMPAAEAIVIAVLVVLAVCNAQHAGKVGCLSRQAREHHQQIFKRHHARSTAICVVVTLSHHVKRPKGG